MFEQTFKNIDDILWKDEGCNSELDYAEQTSWILFLRYLDALELRKAAEAELTGKTYTPILEAKYRWSAWAAPKKADGSFDHDTAMTGKRLIDFVNDELFPYLAGFKQRTQNTNTIEHKIGEIFSEIRNRIASGYTLRDVLERADELQFNSQAAKHELSDLYETRIRNMGNSGRTGGQYYTPRPLIRAMIQVIKPVIGETIYDGAAGSAGFLCEAYDYLRKSPDLTSDDLRTLQNDTFYGKEKQPLAYIIAMMNMILHGVDAPNLVRTNTLSENISDLGERDRHHIILANPPFGGKERKEVQQNFPIKTSETASLFLQHFIKKTKARGRAAIVIKNTFLSNMDNASTALRKELLEMCNLFAVLDCPQGTFQGAGVKTVVLFFEKGRPTERIWYYQLDAGRSLGKTNPLNDDDLKDFLFKQPSNALSDASWVVNRADIDEDTYDLSVKNPNAPVAAPLRSPEAILQDMRTRNAETAELMQRIEAML